MRFLTTLLGALAGIACQLAPGLALAQLPDPPPDHWYGKIVRYDFIQPYAVIPPRDDGILIDTRDTVRRYDVGHIPGAINLPAKQFDELAPRLLPADKNKLILFYCDGIECKLSHMAADDAEDLGYTNIRVYAEGFPDWFKRGNPYAISAGHLRTLIETGEAGMLIDVRDVDAYQRHHLPNARHLPAERFAQQAAGVLPSDKQKPLVFYCDHADARLSYAVARQATALGYRQVMLIEGGYPAWENLAR